MTLFSVRDMVRETGGSLLCGDLGMSITGVCHDSRQVRPGFLFVAIRGERVDGHDFAGEALTAGAGALLVERWEGELPRCGAVCVVDSTVRALGLLARYHRRRFTPVLWGITGSTGKTTTKEMMASVLGTRFSVLANPGNLNTEVGLPLALFNLGRADQIAVLEMGARKQGDIRWLCEIAGPERAVITNVGESHLEVFGSLDGVAAAKGELVEALPDEGIACLNGDDPRVRAMASRTRARVILYGRGADCQVRSSDERLDRDARAVFTLRVGDDEGEVHLPAPGAHQVSNALAAAAAGHASGLTLAEIIDGLRRFTPPDMRMSLVRAGDLTVIDDTYNASPASGRAALRTLTQLASGVRIAILGDMLELGQIARSGHLELGAEAARTGVDLLVTVGDLAGFIREGALKQGLAPERAVHYRSVDRLLEDLPGLVEGGGTVLIKGSRGMRMERIVDALRAREEGDG